MLSDYVKKFDTIEKDIQASGVNRLTPDQAHIFRDVFATYKTGIRYAVLDAPSGTGKTTLIRAMQKHCTTNQIELAITATTGKASSAIGGQTIHSYMGMRMTPNQTADNKDDALKLTASEIDKADTLDILVIDECSMIGKKLFAEIDKARFRYVLFVLDSSQLPPVKEQKVDWSIIAGKQYYLTKTLRARDSRMLKLFDDFRNYKLGNIKELSLMDYVNGDNIVAISYDEIDKLPINTESCIVAYRNKLVEHFVNISTDKKHTMYNLNRGVNITRMVSIDDIPNSNGFFMRDFVNQTCYYNGEDVEIIKLDKFTQELATKKYGQYGKFKLSINKKETGITIADTNAKIPYGAKESPDDKFFLKFPEKDILECCTLVLINNKYFSLLWDNGEEEFDIMLDYYFQQLLPFLSTMRTIKAYRKNPCESTLNKVPSYLRHRLSTSGKQVFDEWFNTQTESFLRKQAWAKFLTASSVVSARPTTSRSIHKAQGISIPCVAISDMSFYGASKDAQYVAVTRCKHGLILITDTPKHLVQKG